MQLIEIPIRVYHSQRREYVTLTKLINPRHVVSFEPALDYGTGELGHGVLRTSDSTYHEVTAEAYHEVYLKLQKSDA